MSLNPAPPQLHIGSLFLPSFFLVNLSKGYNFNGFLKEPYQLSLILSFFFSVLQCIDCCSYIIISVLFQFHGKTTAACLIALSCPTLSTPWTIACQAPLSVGWDFPGKNTVVDCHFLLQRISPTHWNLHCMQILYLLSHQGSPWKD